LKIETDIITSITANSTRTNCYTIQVIMYVETFKTDIIVFIGIKRHNATSH